MVVIMNPQNFIRQSAIKFQTVVVFLRFKKKGKEASEIC